MTRRVAWALAFLAAFAAQGLLRPSRGRPPAAEGAGSLSVLAGAVQPLFVALTWVEAEAALEDRRILDALDRLRRLEAADPAGWEASVFRAHLIAHNLATGGAPDVADRIVEAVGVLDAATGRTRDPGPCVAKGQLMLEARMWDAALSRAIEQRLGATPRDVAVDAFEEARRRAPGSARIPRLLMEALRMSGLERLLGGAPPAAVLGRLDAAREIADALDTDVLSRRLARTWGAAVHAAVRGDADAIARAESGLSEVLRDWARVAPLADESEARFAAALARSAVPLAESRLAAGDARGALSLVRLVHTIRDFVAARLDRTRNPLLQDLAARRRVLSLLDGIVRSNPDLETEVAGIKALVLAW